MHSTSIAPIPRNPLDRVVDRQQIAHITLTITEVIPNRLYDVYTHTKRQGETRIDTAYSLEEAQAVLAGEMEDIKMRFAAMRKKTPTALQLLTLFRFKIPIPVDLTWGQASDLISARMEVVRATRKVKAGSKDE